MKQSHWWNRTLKVLTMGLLLAFMPGVALPNSAHAAFQSSGLIANWTGAGLAGAPSNWVDSVNSNSLALTSTSYNAANGGYLIFNGSGSKAYASSSITTFTPSTVSMFFWINVPDFSATRVIQEIARSPTNTANEQQFLINQTTGTFNYWDYDGTNYGLNGNSTGSITANTWNYVGFVKKPTGGGNASLTFYINGQSAGTITATNSVTLGRADFSLGYDVRDVGSNPRYFSGKIGQASIWSTELTAADVTNNYSATNGNYFSPSITSSSASQSIYLTQSISNVVQTNSGGTATYSVSPALPNGLTLDANSGTISGTPLATSPTTSYTITATNIAGTSTSTFSLTVTQAGVVLSAPSPAIYRQAISIQATPNGSGTLVFYGNGKRIPNCLRVPTNGSMVTCSWRPPFHGENKIYVRFTIAGISGQSSSITVRTTPRTNNR